MIDIANLSTDAEFAEALRSIGEELKDLNEQAMRNRIEIERNKREKEKLEAEMLAEFGTKDLDEIDAILKARQEANRQAVSKFQSDVQDLKKQIHETTETLKNLG